MMAVTVPGLTTQRIQQALQTAMVAAIYSIKTYLWFLHVTMWSIYIDVKMIEIQHIDALVHLHLNIHAILCGLVHIPHPVKAYMQASHPWEANSTYSVDGIATASFTVVACVQNLLVLTVLVCQSFSHCSKERRSCSWSMYPKEARLEANWFSKIINDALLVLIHSYHQ